MSLNCLTCHSLQRTDSEKECRREDSNRFLHRVCSICCAKVERSWSGNLKPPGYERITETGSPLPPQVKKVMKSHHRRPSSIGVAVDCEDLDEPRLVRSSGMRRDWSFENLRERNGKRRESGLK